MHTLWNVSTIPSGSYELRATLSEGIQIQKRVTNKLSNMYNFLLPEADWAFCLSSGKAKTKESSQSCLSCLTK
jgi:hypothetical protein